MHSASSRAPARAARVGAADPAPAGDQASRTAPRELNRLLRALPSRSYERIILRLEPVHMRVGEFMWEANAPIEWVLFPRTLVASLIVPLSYSRPVEAATVGREGLVGVPVVLGVRSTSMRALCQVEGDGARLPAAALTELMAEDDVLGRVLLRYAALLQEHTAQSVACNGRHDVTERCARWLLMTHDRVRADHFYLTQDFLAQMLSVRRATVTLAAGQLQQAGLIRYTRGRVTIVDRERLEAASCECHRMMLERNRVLLG
jgi:CRP-like cAMP-binding protein